MGFIQSFMSLILTILLSVSIMYPGSILASDIQTNIGNENFSSKNLNLHDKKQSNESHHEEEFNPGKMIIQHVLDAHEWHIIDIKGKHISIPLPIIIYSKERGLFCFSSSRFQHGKSYFCRLE